MKLLILLVYGFLLLGSAPSFSQKGPGGVGNTDGLTSLRTWWRADAGVAPVGGPISSWADQSGYGNTLSQPTAGNRPTVAVSAALNNQTIVRYTGASSQFFSSAFSGPAVDNMTLFLVANGTSYQSLIRFQNAGSPYVVYPWENGGGRVFISSSDGGTVSGVATGIVNSVNNIAGARYRRNVVSSGMQTFLNGAVNAQRTSVNAVLPSQLFYSGRYNPGASEYPTCDVGEMMIFYSALNDAQMVLVQNYLAAKYNVALSAYDVYTMDNVVNGNFDFDVAGIGRVDASNIHNDSQGTGFVRILNPTDLGDNEFFVWGHDGGIAQATNTVDIPAGITGRFARIWRISETGGNGDVGNIDVQFDVTGLSDFAGLSTCDAAGSIYLLVDTNNDGLFADQTPISGATNIGGNVYRFANVNTISNGNRFTIGVSSPSVTGPGGVGGTSGTTNLVLWLDANKVSGANGATITAWNDQSGVGNNLTVGNGAVFNTNAVNGIYPAFNFNGTSHYFQAPAFNASITPASFTIFATNRVTSSVTHKAVISNRDDPTGVPTAGFILYSIPTSNNWEFWNGNVGGGWQSTGTGTNTAGVWASQTLEYQPPGTNNKKLSISNVAAPVQNTHTMLSNTVRALRVGAGQNEAAPNFYFSGLMGEIIMYNSVLNSAQQIIVNNYLAAKYNFALTSNDVYTRDNPPNGNFDHDVAGIGQVNATNKHNDARGSGIIHISNPSALVNNAFFMWGHDNGSLTSTNITDVPVAIQGRMNRVWAVSETIDVGSIDVKVDMTGQGSVTASDLRLLVDHDGDGIFNELGTIIISGASAQSCNIYKFNAVSSINDGMRFTIGTVNISQTPLPVELTSFSGQMNDGIAELLWTTASEHNNDYFDIERSEDGEKFSSILNVAGAGQSSTTIKYHTKDEFPPQGKLYYRLKQVDYDGHHTYSKTISLTNLFAEERIVVSPNPVRIGEELFVKIVYSESIDAEEITFTLNDLLGRPVPLLYVAMDNNYFKITTKNVGASGIYILRLRISHSNKELFQRIYLVD